VPEFDGWHRHHAAAWPLFLSPDGLTGPKGPGTHGRADQSGAGGRAQAGAGCRPEAPYDAEQDRVSAATPAWQDATPGGGTRSRGLHPYPLSLGTGVKPLRSRAVRDRGRERRKWEHTLPRFPFHCYTNPEHTHLLPRSGRLSLDRHTHRAVAVP